ncbi:ABC transporter substrate-binding protein [Methylocystis sp. SC2]|uniref:ABC transporter substrate-binding protein n=1 Tax=Methylocystis sp. (strain SC2) TaxID=187303 RepID=UPI00027AE93D|nr:extracellular solute-binding protein [Methylocystis sp. SC2]CCJ07360.1 Extracellular solute-binding protein family 1 [Methylocystis sp. SC2]
MVLDHMIRAVVVAAFASLFSILGAAPSGGSTSETFTVVTSFPEELTTRYEREFERSHPQFHVQFVWKQSRDALAELAKPEQGGADVYWAPAPANFARLRDWGAFRKLMVDRAALPGRLGRQQLSDPAGLYEAYDVAGYGIVANPSALAAAGLSAPRRWDDLASPEYARRLAMPIASKVGFSPALYDIVLQSEGWDAGWRLLGEMAGEATLLDSGLAPTASVREGTAALALTIDFFAEIAKANGAAVEMIYPQRTAFLPAHVAMTAASKHVAGAQAFIDFLLSTDGQRLMMERDSRRHPARPDAYQSASQGFANPFALPASALLDYDSEIGRRRPPLIALLFDLAIVDGHDESAELWRKIHDAEKKFAGDAKALAALGEAKRLAGFVPVSETDARATAFLERFQRRDAIDARQITQWREEIGAARRQARDLVKSLEPAP